MERGPPRRRPSGHPRGHPEEHALATSLPRSRARRRARACCALPAALLAAAACGTAAGSAAVDPQAVGPASGRITWYAINFGPEGLPERLISAFEEDHPDISVEYQPAPNNTDTMRATLTTEISGGSGAIDVYNGDIIWPAQFGSATLAMPLDEHLPDDFWDRYPEQRAEAVEYEGEHLAAPLYGDAGFLYYRKDLLQRHGLEVPRTWEELAETAARLQDEGEVKYGYVAQWANYEGLTVNWTELSAAAGGRSISRDGDRAAIDSPANRRVLDFMRGMLQDDVVPSATNSFQEPQSLQTFVEGDAAFHRNWSHGYSESNNPEVSRVAGKVGVAPLPAFEGEEPPGPSALAGWNLMVNPHSDAVGAVLAFIEWMTGDEAQRILAENTVLPAVRDVLEDPGLRRENPVLDLAADVPLVARPAETPRYAQVSNGIFTNLNAALTGATSPRSALRAAEEDIQRALEGDAL
ncbi:ABC transporter substrate-binding protein [Streptomyces sp. DSM 44917]|uniref:ABC transporter substrate-binding protein n=1 Tax=Streptomyces boetiae TaxID=3075541 RepID=A0ABU2L3W0_9ACTN|nr:ABC transporter substrate-binding protein [Streptomyces sp. DSM 44917]MDT0306244.1 ABC transporter substrate-binding protein [Streptomyces sp. DSM 44917]